MSFALKQPANQPTRNEKTRPNFIPFIPFRPILSRISGVPYGCNICDIFANPEDLHQLTAMRLPMTLQLMWQLEPFVALIAFHRRIVVTMQLHVTSQGRASAESRSADLTAKVPARRVRLEVAFQCRL
jgi:hypothetical protein